MIKVKNILFIILLIIFLSNCLFSEEGDKYYVPTTLLQKLKNKQEINFEEVFFPVRLIIINNNEVLIGSYGSDPLGVPSEFIQNEDVIQINLKYIILTRNSQQIDVIGKEKFEKYYSEYNYKIELKDKTLELIVMEETGEIIEKIPFTNITSEGFQIDRYFFEKLILSGRFQKFNNNGKLDGEIIIKYNGEIISENFKYFEIERSYNVFHYKGEKLELCTVELLNKNNDSQIYAIRPKGNGEKIIFYETKRINDNPNTGLIITGVAFTLNYIGKR